MAQGELSVRERIIQAYAELLARENYLDITVTDLARQAGVGRASFYRGFSTVEDVMNALADQVFQRFTRDVFPLFLHDQENGWKNLLLNFFHGLRQQGNMPFVLPGNREFVMAHISKRFESTLPADYASFSIYQKYLPPLNISIAMLLGMQWMNHGFRESAEEMAELAYQLIHHNLELLRLTENKKEK